MDAIQKKAFREGEIIFTEGDRGNCAYIVEQGRVKIFVSHEEEHIDLSFIGPGEIFGEMSVIDGSPRSASAICLEPCELTIVSSEQIYERIESADSIVRLLIVMLLKRMRSTNETAKGQWLQGQEEPIVPPRNFVESRALTDQHRVVNKMKFEKDLKDALDSNEFELHYQPILELKTQNIVGFEALIRWQSPIHGLVGPDLFIGLAEETSLIIPIGAWATSKAITALAEMNKLRLEKDPKASLLFMSVNVSDRQLKNETFFQQLRKTVKSKNLDHNLIKLEVTERMFMEGESAIHAVNRCRKIGFPVALDDFGTGFSSLSYLIQFHVDSLKIDKSFVRLMINDHRAMVLTKAIVDIANGLGIPVIAEGIETEEEYQQLLGLGCRFGQGFLFSKAVPFNAACSLFLNNKKYCA